MRRKESLCTMESYEEFLQRIGKFEQEELCVGEGNFQTSEKVHKKVFPDNTFRPYYGDTVVFDLDSRTKKRIDRMIDTLYAAVPECFCERLTACTLHMTLHDLSASENKEEAAAAAFDNEIGLLRLLQEEPLEAQFIKMRPHFAVNMLGTSLVLALVPDSREQWEKLQVLYDFLSRIRQCPYPYLTPHVTLAYYNYSGFGEESVQKLKETVEEINRQPSFDIILNTQRLFYQKFVDMNSYFSVFRLSGN